MSTSFTNSNSTILITSNTQSRLHSIILASFISRCIFFFFNDTATTEIYTLSLHDALPIFQVREIDLDPGDLCDASLAPAKNARDRKSTRLNSSHSQISYAVFCLKKKKRLGRVDGGRCGTGICSLLRRPGRPPTAVICRAST